MGWREWVVLPGLGIERIKAKVDSGARTSSLHAIHVQTIEVDGAEWVSFDVHPVQRDAHETVRCRAPVAEHRIVRSSTGHREKRPVIVTELDLGGLRWPIELTLTSRDAMGFRMLLGREAVRGRALIDPGRSYLLQTSPGTRPTRWRHP